MDKQNKYIYPAIFTYEEGYEIAVTFPDLPGCATSGASEQDALDMAKDALSGHLWCLDKDGDDIPIPTRLRDIELDINEQATLIEVSMPFIAVS